MAVVALLAITPLPHGDSSFALGDSIPADRVDGFVFDPETQHTYVYEARNAPGPISNDFRVYELDRDGRVVRRSQELPLPGDLLMEEDLLWLSLFDRPEIVALARDDLSVVERHAVDGFEHLHSISKRGDTVYFSYGCYDQEVGIGSLDLETGLARDHPQMADDELRCLHHDFVDLESGRLFVWDVRGTLRLYEETVAGPLLIDERELEDGIRDVAITSDGRFAFVAHISEMRKIDLATLEDVDAAPTPQATSSLDLDPDENLIAAGGGDYGDVTIRKVSDLSLHSRIPFGSEQHGHVVLFQNGSKVLADYDVPAPVRIVITHFLRKVVDRRVWELDPAASADYEAWSSASLERRRWFDVYVRKRGGPVRKVNPPGTEAYAGGIDGDRLVYQQRRGASSDLIFYDLGSRKRTRPGRANTRAWEWRPSASGRWLLFGRSPRARLGGGAIVLHDLRSGRSRILDRTGPRSVLLADHVNGNHAVWTECGRRCSVFHHDIAAGRTRRLPQRWALQFGASVTPDGTIYYGKSGPDCGDRSGIVRHPLGRGPRVIMHLGYGLDVDRTHVRQDSSGVNHVYFTRYPCYGHAPDSGIYSFADP